MTQMPLAPTPDKAPIAFDERNASSPEHVAPTLEDLVRIAATGDVPWALVGGQSLIAHGVRRETDDVDVLVARHATLPLATELCRHAGWTPLRYRAWTRDYTTAAEPTLHHFDDVVLFSLPFERVMYSLRSPTGLLVQLLAAQHPMERAMVADALPGVRCGVEVPLGPLGGVLVVKALAGRAKDTAAIELTLAQSPRSALDEAVAWLRRHDAHSAAWLAATIERSKV